MVADSQIQAFLVAVVILTKSQIFADVAEMEEENSAKALHSVSDLNASLAINGDPKQSLITQLLQHVATRLQQTSSSLNKSGSGGSSSTYTTSRIKYGRSLDPQNNTNIEGRAYLQGHIYGNAYRQINADNNGKTDSNKQFIQMNSDFIAHSPGYKKKAERNNNKSINHRFNSAQPDQFTKRILLTRDPKLRKNELFEKMWQLHKKLHFRKTEELDNRMQTLKNENSRRKAQLDKTEELFGRSAQLVKNEQLYRSNQSEGSAQLGKIEQSVKNENLDARNIQNVISNVINTSSNQNTQNIQNTRNTQNTQNNLNNHHILTNQNVFSSSHDQRSTNNNNQNVVYNSITNINGNQPHPLQPPHVFNPHYQGARDYNYAQPPHIVYVHEPPRRRTGILGRIFGGLGDLLG